MTKQNKKNKKGKLSKQPNQNQEQNESLFTQSGIEENLNALENQDQKRKKRTFTLHSIISKIILLFTALSCVLTAYDIFSKFHREGNETLSITNSSHINNSYISNQTNQTILNSTMSNIDTSPLNIINLSFGSIASLMQISFLTFNTIKFNQALRNNKSILKYIHKEFTPKNLFYKTIGVLGTLQAIIRTPKPIESEVFIESNYGRYLLYKILQTQNALDSKFQDQINILRNFLNVLRETRSSIEAQKKNIKYRPEINLFVFRFFENSDYSVNKRKYRILDKSYKALCEEYDHFVRSDGAQKSYIENYIKEYDNHIHKISRYSRSQMLFWTAVAQNASCLAQNLDVIGLTYGTVGFTFLPRDAYFKYYTLLTLAIGTSYMSYDFSLMKQKEHDLMINNMCSLLNANTDSGLKFTSTQIMNPSYSLKTIRKKQSYFGSIKWCLVPISIYYGSFLYSHFLGERNYENTTIIRSMCIVAMATMTKRIETFLKQYETEGNESQLKKLALLMTINFLMPQGAILSISEMMRKKNVGKYLILGMDLVGKVVCGFFNVLVNVLTQKYSVKDSQESVKACIEYIETELEMSETSQDSEKIVNNII